MALISIPDPDALILLSIEDSVPDQLNRSVWTSRSQVVGLPGAEMWFIKAALEPISTETDERPWRAFAFGLKGRQNRFHFPVACQRHIGGKPLVDIGATDGYSLPLKGMAASTRILFAGQYLTVPLPSGHFRLVCLTEDIFTDAAGKATAQFNFELGEVPALDTVIESANPFVPVRSSSNRGAFTYDNAISGRAFELEEAL